MKKILNNLFWYTSGATTVLLFALGIGIGGAWEEKKNEEQDVKNVNNTEKEEEA